MCSNFERAKREALGGPVGGLAQGLLFGLVFLGVHQATRSWEQDRPLLAVAFALLASVAVFVNARWVVPVWRGETLRECVLLFGGTWGFVLLLVGLGKILRI